MKRLKVLISAALMLTLVACGGGGGSAGKNAFEADPTGSTSTSSEQALTLAVSLLDGAGNVSTALVGANTLRVQAVLKKGGVVQADQLVQFSVDQAGNYATLDQLTALTDSNGIAVVTLKPGTVSGAGQVQAVATLLDGTTVEGAANFLASPTAQSSGTLTLANLQVGSTTVSAYGTVGFSVAVRENGSVPSQPVTVSFSSDCAAGKASITTSAQTNSSGVATGTFEDLGCAATSTRSVVLTASIPNDSDQISVNVLPSSVGSLRFVSVDPADASIVIGGGVGRQQNAQLVFKVVNQRGDGVDGVDVCLDSTTYVGGLTLDGYNNTKLPPNRGSLALCGDPSVDKISNIRLLKTTIGGGFITVQIGAGNLPTPVRVRARAIFPSTATTALETFSDSLSISTGLPLQRSMDLSVDKANIDAGNGTAGGAVTGDKSILTVRLADQFSNPVPDGTVVSFIASGGAVCQSQRGACKTTNGTCSCELVGSAERPLDGRVVVMAYADGLEDYVDVDDDGVYTLSSTDTFTDLADAFVDADKSGAFNSNSRNGDEDIGIPFQSPANYVGGDSQRGNAHIRASSIIYFSAPSGTGDPTVVIPRSDLSITRDLVTGTTTSPFIRIDTYNGCPNEVPQASFTAVLDDGYGNPMAAGTTVSATDFPDTMAPKSVRPSAVLPFGARNPDFTIDGNNVIKITPWSTTAHGGNVTTQHSVTIQGVKEKCSGSGSFVLDISSPKGGAAKTARVLYEGDPRSTSRFRFPARFIDEINLRLASTVVDTSEAVQILSADVSPIGADFASFTLNWGDGTVETGTGSIVTQSHAYATTGSKVVRLTVLDAAGRTYTTSVVVSVLAP